MVSEDPIVIQTFTYPSSFNVTVQKFYKMVESDPEFKAMMAEKSKTYHKHSQNKLISVSIRFAISTYVRNNELRFSKIEKMERLKKIMEKQGDAIEDE